MKHISQKYGNYEFVFDRVNVILGANGAGKSTFLQELKTQIPSLLPGTKAVYIEGGRTITIKDILQLDHTNVAQYDRLESALAAYEGKRVSSLASRVFDALVVLEKKGIQLKSTHSDDVESWVEGGQKTEYPKRKQPPLDRLFELFNEIFPQIILSFSNDARRLSAIKNGSSYGPSQLSDGEKQVFSILADLIELDDSHKIIIADEPELNLHPELAERLWTLIENEFPQKLFIYATHSINFALRENVEKIYILSSDSENITEFKNFEDLDRSEFSAFLGGLPGILSTNKVVVTEGHEKSFDSIFYRWILGDNSIEIYPGGGCTDVVGIVSKNGMWDKISSSITLIGIIDADYRNDVYLNSFNDNSLSILELHEAESFLCLPEILVSIADRIGSQENTITKEFISEKIFSTLETQKLSIAAKRLFSQAKISLGVSLQRKILSGIDTQEALIKHLKSASESEIQKAVEAVGQDVLEEQLINEIKYIDKALSNKDIIQALKLLPGKELLNQLAPKAGCRNSTDIMRSLRRNFKPEDFTPTKQLKVLLERGINS